MGMALKSIVHYGLSPGPVLHSVNMYRRGDSAMNLIELLKIIVKENGSDLILKVGAFPAERVDGKIRFISENKVEKPFSEEVIASILNEEKYRKYRDEGEVDSAFEVPDVGRFRVNLFHQAGEMGAVFRYIKSNIPSFEDLNLPAKQMERLSSLKRGLVLATGIAGSGKSTALAAMIEYINRNYRKHVVTIEDPIEFMFTDRFSVINQREIGMDTRNFAYALKHCVRQSPDVIYIGEMRDKETMEAAIAAAETGHLVFSTLHTVNAVQSVERIITYFPPYQHDLIRLQLSLILEGVLSLRLLSRKGKSGRVPAVELMLATPTIREHLFAGRTKDLSKAIADGEYYGTISFNQSLRNLLEQGEITYEEAVDATDSPDELKLELRGITKGTKSQDNLF